MCVQACMWVSQAALLIGWLKFHSLESVSAAPAVETFPDDVQTGSIRQESNLNSQLHGKKNKNFSLEAFTCLSYYLQSRAIFHSKQFIYHLPLLCRSKHTLCFFLWFWPHASTSQGHWHRSVHSCSLLPRTAASKCYRDGFISACFDFLSHWSIWAWAVLANNPILTHFKQTGKVFFDSLRIYEPCWQNMLDLQRQIWRV